MKKSVNVLLLMLTVVLAPFLMSEMVSAKESNNSKQWKQEQKENENQIKTQGKKMNENEKKILKISEDISKVSKEIDEYIASNTTGGTIKLEKNKDEKINSQPAKKSKTSDKDKKFSGSHRTRSFVGKLNALNNRLNALKIDCNDSAYSKVLSLKKEISEQVKKLDNFDSQALHKLHNKLEKNY